VSSSGIKLRQAGTKKKRAQEEEKEQAPSERALANYRWDQSTKPLVTAVPNLAIECVKKITRGPRAWGAPSSDLAAYRKTSNQRGGLEREALKGRAVTKKWRW